MAGSIKRIIQDAATETAKRDDQDLGVGIEAIQSNVKHILDAVDTHTRQIGQLQADMGALKKNTKQLKDDVTVIKLAVQGTQDEKKCGRS